MTLNFSAVFCLVFFEQPIAVRAFAEHLCTAARASFLLTGDVAAIREGSNGVMS